MKIINQCLLIATLSLTGIAPALADGIASWYGPGFNGKLTANGETFNMHAMTAAHKTLPFGTRIKVTNRKTGKSAEVCINDRGPYAKNRIIDLSKSAAQKIGLLKTGHAPVTLEILHKPKASRYGKKVCS